MKRILSFLLMACLLTGSVVNSWADDSNQDKYLSYYLIISEGDRLVEQEQFASASGQYQNALSGLQSLPKEWEPAIVNYRIRYCKERIAELAGREDRAPATPTGTNQVEQIPKPAADLADAADQNIDMYKAQIQTLKTDLEIKTEELKQAHLEIADLRQRLTDTQNELAQVKGSGTDQQVAQLLTENSSLKDQLSKAEEQLKSINGENSESAVALMKAQLKKVQDQLELQRKANEAFEDTTASLKQQLSDARSALDVAQSKSPEAVNPEAFSRENAVLRNIVERQLKEQARRDAARKLAQSELESLQIESQTLQQQIDILASPLVELSNEELALLRGPSPSVQPPTNELVAQITDTPTAPAVPADSLTEIETSTTTVMATPVQDVDMTAPVAAPAAEGSPAAEAAPASDTAPAVAAADTPEATPAADVTTGVPEVAMADTPSPDSAAPAETGTDTHGVKPDTEIVTTSDTVTDVASVQETPATDVTDVVAPPSTPTETVETALVAVDTPEAAPNQAHDYSSTPIVPDDFKDEARHASELFSSGRFDEAAAIYQKMIDKYPESLYAWSNLGVVRFEQKKLDEAETALEKAVKLSPNDGFSYSILGIVYYQRGNYDKAVDRLTRARTLDPNDPRTRNYLGIACSQKGWQEAAERELRKAVELDPSFGDAHFNLAVIYATQKPPSKGLANKHYEEAKRLGIPSNPQLDLLLK